MYQGGGVWHMYQGGGVWHMYQGGGVWHMYQGGGVWHMYQGGGVWHMYQGGGVWHMYQGGGVWHMYQGGGVWHVYQGGGVWHMYQGGGVCINIPSEALSPQPSEANLLEVLPYVVLIHNSIGTKGLGYREYHRATRCHRDGGRAIVDVNKDVLKVFMCSYFTFQWLCYCVCYLC